MKHEKAAPDRAAFLRTFFGRAGERMFQMGDGGFGGHEEIWQIQRVVVSCGAPECILHTIEQYLRS